MVRFSLPAALLLSLLFFAAGFIFIRQVGVQQDEVLFTTAVVPPFEYHYAIELRGRPFTAMIMPYLGTLKAHLWSKVFALRPADVFAIRLPVMVLSAATLLLYWAIFRLTLGHLVAVLVVGLLAFDPLYVITSTLDWGPVVLQRFLFAAGLLALVFYHRRQSPWLLALAGFVFGLGVWDKATFFWLLGAYSLAAFLVYPAVIVVPFTFRRLGILLLAGALGGAPFVYYNFHRPAETLAWTPQSEVLPYTQRAVIMKRTLDGSALFDYLTRQDAPPVPPVRTGVESAGVGLSGLTGHFHRHLLFPSLFVALGLALFVRRSAYAQATFFAAIALLSGWLVMFAFAMGGQGSHHMVLLWPLPHLMVACALCEIARRRRWIALAAAAVIAGSEALVTNEYYAQIVRNGPQDYWTTAAEPLRAYLAQAAPNGIYPLEWGIMGPLRALGRGTLQLGFTPEWLDAGSEFRPQDRAALEHLLNVVSPYFVRYVDRTGRSNGPVDRLVARSAELGFKEHRLATIADRHGRPMYLVTQFRPAP
ncbi:MAG: glycosyltransferase family 39 protein [Acidobacteria bacterium]|nr:glycosyltransferase family 39 protein [Acidobacteriota bacterium]